MTPAAERAAATRDASAAPVRAFLAIRLPPGVQERVVRLKHRLEETGAAVRWARDESLHLTLKFLGSVSSDRLDDLRTAVGQSVGAVPSFTARVAGLGVFPRPDRPRIVWVGVEAPPLKDLAAAVDMATAELGFQPEDRPFRGHVSLGRIKERRGWSRLAAALREHGEADFGTFEIREITACRSELQRGGSVYSDIWTVPLSIGIGGGDHGIGRESRASTGPGRQPY